MRAIAFVVACVSLVAAENVVHRHKGHSCVHNRIMENLDVGIATDAYPDGFPLTCESADGQYIESTGTAATMSSFSSCTAADVMQEGDDKYLFLVDQILVAAVDFLNRALSVLPVESNLILSQTWSDNFCFHGSSVLPFVCCDSILPPPASTTGVPNADFVLYVTKRPTLGSTLAWALPCQYDGRTNSNGRPVMGQANFSPARISIAAEDYAEQLSTAIHEIAHALGFTSGRYSSFINPVTGAALQSVLSVEFDALLQKTVTKIVTPNVVAALKDHFGCSDWTNAGGELEDAGGAGTSGSHWEKRIMFNEFMTGTSDPNSVYSAITLAYFQDTGWYQVDYSVAEPLPWGAGEGCAFVQRRCGESWGPRYFCETLFEEGCTADSRYRAVCNLQVSALTLSPAYQYFPDANTGGASEYPDYCPYYVRVSSGDCKSPATRHYWHFGESSIVAGSSSTRCFAGTFVRESTISPVQHGACLEWTCDPVTALLQVTLAGLADDTYVITCPSDGGSVDVSAGTPFVGVLDCPRRELYCTGSPCDLQTCSGHGTCDDTDGSCTCQALYSGTECEIRECNAPAGRPGDQCYASEGRGTCRQCADLPDGQCSVGEESVCVCEEGFSGSACQTRGCVEAGTPPSPCSGQGTCNVTATSSFCACDEGWTGNACQLRTCPGTPKCGGAARGTCDEANGLCSCADNVFLVENATAGLGRTVHYTGADCGNEGAGVLPLVPLQFYGEDDDPTGENAVVVLDPRAYRYFNFTVPSTRFPITVQVTFQAAGAGAGDAPSIADIFLVASYASRGVLPTLANNEFVGNGSTSLNTRAMVFEEVTSEEVSVQNPFDKTGTMMLGLVSVVPDRTAQVDVRVLRDGCVQLEPLCQHDTACDAGLCQCGETRIHTTVEGPPDVTYTSQWSGQFCDIPDCPQDPGSSQDCNGNGVCVPVNSTTGGRPVPTCVCNTFFSGIACQNQDTEGTAVSIVDISAPPALGEPPAVRTSDAGGVFAVATTNATGVVAAGIVTDLTAAGGGASARRLDADPRRRLQSDALDGLPVNGTFTLALNFDRAMAVVVRLVSYSPDADPMLMTNSGQPPTLTTREKFDVVSWTSQASVHTITAFALAGKYYVSVYNSLYATTVLNATLHWEVSELCPPSMANTSSTLPANVSIPGVPAEWCGGHAASTTSFCAQPDSGSPPNEPVMCECAAGWEGAYCTVPAPVLGAGLPEATGVVNPGEWKYYTFASATNDAEVEVSLTRTSASTRAQPLLLVGRWRPSGALGPETRSTDTLQSIQEDAYYDFDGFTSRNTTQRVLISRSPAVISVAANNFYYIGVHNTVNARASMEATVNVTTRKVPAVTCTSSDVACLEAASASLCKERGVAQPDTIAGGDALLCRCNSGWNQVTNCASPRVFQTFSALVDATQRIEFLCNVCEVSDALGSTDVRFFTVPQPLQRATGLTLKTVNTTALAGLVPANPALMVAPYRPRSVTDFTAVSSSDFYGEEVTLTEPSPTGTYYFALYANEAGHVTVQAERAKLDGDSSNDEQFIAELVEWLTTTGVGNVVFVLSMAFLLCVCLGCFCQHIECKGCRPKRRQNGGLGVFGDAGAGGMFGKSPDLVGSHIHHHQGGAGRVGMAAMPSRGAKATPGHRGAVEMAPLHRTSFSNPMHSPPPVSPVGGFVPPPPPPMDAYSGTPVAAYMPDGSAPPPPPPMDTAPRALQMRLRAMRAGSMVGGQASILGPRKEVAPPPAI